MKKEGKQSNSSGFLTALISVLTVLVLLLLVLYPASYVIRRHYLVVGVVGTSMVHTLEDGDVLYSTREGKPERGDIVIVDVEGMSDFSSGTKVIIKRVIALEGDKVKCENGIVYLAISGGEYEPLDEPYIEGRNKVEFECTLGDGEIYVMGDNRENSMDSRRVGPLRMEKVLGVVPEWAIEYKAVIKGWEDIKTFLFGWIKW